MSDEIDTTDTAPDPADPFDTRVPTRSPALTPAEERILRSTIDNALVTEVPTRTVKRLLVLIDELRGTPRYEGAAAIMLDPETGRMPFVTDHPQRRRSDVPHETGPIASATERMRDHAIRTVRFITTPASADTFVLLVAENTPDHHEGAVDREQAVDYFRRVPNVTRVYTLANGTHRAGAEIALLIERNLLP